MRWRPTLIVLHRDIGFLCVGLTLAYAISGIAVNHAHHWNYNRSEYEERRAIGTPVEILTGLSVERKAAIASDVLSLTDEEERLLVVAIGKETGRKAPPRNVFWTSPERINLFYGEGDRDTVVYHPRSGDLHHVVRKDRWLLRDLNFLHLNEGRGVWTYIADAYALMLIFLAISGAIVVKGRRGLKGRGGVLIFLGLLVPIVALFLMRCS